jgi:hypothetical protein
LATFEGITLEEAWQIPIVQSFNDLSYLKAKDKHDKEIQAERKNALRMQL